MPTLTINIPQGDYKKIERKARSEGFRRPSDWAHFLVAQNLILDKSPRISPSEVISRMKKTGLYKEGFLKGLKQSLQYADRLP